MTAVEYAWRESSFHWGLDAGKVGRELERIRERHDGVLDASVVVEASRKPTAVLHDVIFHIPEEDAAQKHYEHRARQVLGALTIRVVDQSTPPVRAYVAIGGGEADAPLRPYYPAQVVRSNPELSASYRGLLLRRLVGLRTELAAWDEFSEVVAAIDDAEKIVAEVVGSD